MEELHEKITNLEKQLDEATNTFKVCLALKNGKIKQLESDLANVNAENSDLRRQSEEAVISQPPTRNSARQSMNLKRSTAAPPPRSLLCTAPSIPPNHNRSFRAIPRLHIPPEFLGIFPHATNGDLTGFLDICPNVVLAILWGSYANITMRNTSDKPVSFKVKIRHRELFHVTPNNGRIEPGANRTVRVTTSGPHPSINRSKFLIQSVQHDSTDIDPFDKLLENSPKELKAERKLCCKIIF
ncbi:hypothetical protein PENTCL1PPCAC_23655 [Pristionchus entomophagus]|uniref:Major sperm protein n=1 Tax=Pristionchus entomophagus TaxID=358040 RepID=A0AAV5U3P4_9BILA|nr:hypothetical protein PENTCL1PPCAC_23655 [Pristionchus entomophagus]